LLGSTSGKGEPFRLRGILPRTGRGGGGGGGGGGTTILLKSEISKRDHHLDRLAE